MSFVCSQKVLGIYREKSGARVVGNDFVLRNPRLPCDEYLLIRESFVPVARFCGVIAGQFPPKRKPAMLKIILLVIMFLSFSVFMAKTSKARIPKQVQDRRMRVVYWTGGICIAVFALLWLIMRN